MRVHGIVKEAQKEKVLGEAKVTLFVGEKEVAVLYSDKKGRFEHKESASYVGETLTWEAEKDGFKINKGTYKIEEEEVPLELELEPQKVDEPEEAPKKSKTWIWIVAGVVLLLGIAALVYFLFIAKPAPPAAPELVSFGAKPESIKKGEASTLSWEVKNSSDVLLDGGAVDPEGQKEVRPPKTTTYSLTARNEEGEETGGEVTVKVAVSPAPEIIVFTANPSNIKAGKSSVLRWKTRNARKVRLNDELVESTGSKEVFPGTTTTYTLTALGEGRKDRASTNVNVKTPQSPVIEEFSADTFSIQQGEFVKLRWRTSNATSIQIEGIGDVSSIGDKRLQPGAATTYILIAKNEDGEVRQSIRIDVSKPTLPKIEHFSVGRTRFTVGRSRIGHSLVTSLTLRRPGTVFLRWKVSGAGSVRIDPQLGAVSASGTKGVMVSKTTKFKLTATNSAGFVSRTVTVRVALVLAPRQPPRVVMPVRPSVLAIATTPTLVSPKNGSVFHHFPRKTQLKWNGVPGAVSYTVEIQHKEGNLWVKNRKVSVTGTSFDFHFAGAQPGRWRVWGVKSDGKTTPATGWWEFRYTQ